MCQMSLTEKQREILERAREIIRKRKEADEYIYQCIQAGICPDCGNELSKKLIMRDKSNPSPHNIYNCSCGFVRHVTIRTH